MTLQNKDEDADKPSVDENAEENDNIIMDGLVDYMSTLVPGSSLSATDTLTGHQPPLPPKARPHSNGNVQQLNGSPGSDEEASLTPPPATRRAETDSAEPAIAVPPEAPPVVPPRKRDNRKPTPPVSNVRHPVCVQFSPL